MTRYLVKNYLGLCFCLSFYAFFAIPMGMMTISAAVFSSLYYLPNLVISFIKKKPLKTLAINYSIWIFVFVVVTSFHHFQAKTKKSHALVVLNSIEQYFEQHNQYPESIEVLKTERRKAKYRIFYQYEKGKPFLFYSSNYDPYMKHYYSFTESKWSIQKPCYRE